MWADLEGRTGSPDTGTWQEMARSAVSGLIICVLVLAAFAAAGSPRIL